MSILLLFMLAICPASPAEAQGIPSIQLSGGYSFFSDSRIDEDAHGWFVSGTRNTNRWLGWTGEVHGIYASPYVQGVDVDISLHAFLAGVQFSHRNTTNATPFAHFLAGPSRATTRYAGGSHETSTGFVFQSGAGADFWLTPRWDLRLAVDYRRLRDSGRNANEFGLRVGIVWKSPMNN